MGDAKRRNSKQRSIEFHQQRQQQLADTFHFIKQVQANPQPLSDLDDHLLIRSDMPAQDCLYRAQTAIDILSPVAFKAQVGFIAIWEDEHQLWESCHDWHTWIIDMKRNAIWDSLAMLQQVMQQLDFELSNQWIPIASIVHPLQLKVSATPRPKEILQWLTDNHPRAHRETILYIPGFVTGRNYPREAARQTGQDGYIHDWDTVWRDIKKAG